VQNISNGELCDLSILLLSLSLQGNLGRSHVLLYNKDSAANWNSVYEEAWNDHETVGP
jgi:hypothetical protein